MALNSSASAAIGNLSGYAMKPLQKSAEATPAPTVTINKGDSRMGTPELTPRLMTAPIAARYLGISETSLRGLDLPRKKLGNKRLFDRLELDAYINSLETEGETLANGW